MECVALYNKLITIKFYLELIERCVFIKIKNYPTFLKLNC